MELQRAPETRPAEHLIRAHLAHASHLGELDGHAEGRLSEAAQSLQRPPEPASPPKRKARRKTA